MPPKRRGGGYKILFKDESTLPLCRDRPAPMLVAKGRHCEEEQIALPLCGDRPQKTSSAQKSAVT
jgi:hypothetical protein